jgi:hypothetical protein
MFSHLAEGMYPAPELLDGMLEDQIKAVPVAVFEKDRIAGVASENNVVYGAGEMDAGFTSHGGRISANVRKSNLTPKTKCPKVKPDPKN